MAHPLRPNPTLAWGWTLRIGFSSAAELITASRIPRAMSIANFVLAIVLSIYLGYSRLSHIRFIAKDPLLTGMLQVAAIPGQSTM